jgi:small basic protein
VQLVVNALWEAGAEAIAINGQRIVATTAIRSAGGAVLINYKVLTSPDRSARRRKTFGARVQRLGDREAVSELGRGVPARLPSEKSATPDVARVCGADRVAIRATGGLTGGTMIVIISLLIGVGLGVFLRPTVPASVAPYLPMAVMAALDSVFGGLRARLDGTFSERVFVVSLLANSILAAMLVFAGDRLGVNDLSVAVVVVFGVRIFGNLAAIRRRLFHA